MDTTRITRTTGTLGALGGASMMLLAGLQMADRLGENADAVLSAIGFLGAGAVLYGMLHVGAAGSSRVGRGGLVLWIVGVLSIVLGALAQLVYGLSQDNNAFMPIGGLGQLVGGIVAGIAIARAAVLPGWVRWAALVWGLYFALVMMPIGFSAADGSLAAALPFFGLGALVTATSVGFAGTAPSNVGSPQTSAVPASR